LPKAAVETPVKSVAPSAVEPAPQAAVVAEPTPTAAPVAAAEPKKKSKFGMKFGKNKK